jgi:tRNA uridine 5-carboxymethylaminomethyl modification enzyme
MFTGMIQGVGPRYCPSIEDKVKRFRDKERHQIFLEPEGLSTDEVYVNGVSTSLPRDVQDQFIHSIAGLERAEFIRYGYAVEYDAIDARQLRQTLESKDISGLFCAGQLNGTSGYEEAGAQGLMAGMNAALRVQGRDSFVLGRSDGYIGVMIDDLVLKGSDEPYRMFTSRAEYRLLLREDNADLRLGDLGRSIGLLGDAEYRTLCTRREQIEKWRNTLSQNYLNPTEEVNSWLVQHGLSPLKDRVSWEGLLRRPEVDWERLMDLGLPEGSTANPDIREQVEIQVKYEGYIRRDLDLLEGIRKNDRLRIPEQVNFDEIPGLSNEVKARFRETRPETIGQASRMQGITPAAIAGLMIHLKMRENAPATEALNHGK